MRQNGFGATIRVLPVWALTVSSIIVMTGCNFSALFHDPDGGDIKMMGDKWTDTQVLFSRGNHIQAQVSEDGGVTFYFLNDRVGTVTPHYQGTGRLADALEAVVAKREFPDGTPVSWPQGDPVGPKLRELADNARALSRIEQDCLNRSCDFEKLNRAIYAIDGNLYSASYVLNEAEMAFFKRLADMMVTAAWDTGRHYKDDFAFSNPLSVTGKLAPGEYDFDLSQVSEPVAEGG